jgi:hypothetical protein
MSNSIEQKRRQNGKKVSDVLILPAEEGWKISFRSNKGAFAFMCISSHFIFSLSELKA